MGLLKKYIYRIRYTVIWLQKLQGTTQRKYIRNYKRLSEPIRLNNRTYCVDVEHPTYYNDMSRVYILDYESGNQLSFYEASALMDPKSFDKIYQRKIIEELARGIMKNTKELIVYAILGGIVGALIAVVICMAIYTGKIQEILSQQVPIMVGD